MHIGIFRRNADNLHFYRLESRFYIINANSPIKPR